MAAAVVAQTCTIPDEPLSNTISEGFAVRVLNPEWPVVHNRFMNLFEAGGGDKHLYLSPAGAYAFDLVLNEGVLEQGGIRGVINGEYELADNTTKLFMTERGDPRAIFAPTYACNTETDELQVELAFVERRGGEDGPGGHICVRSASGERYEFRYSPPENPAYTEDRPCIPVTLVLDRSDPPPPSTTTSAPPPTGPTATPDIFADVTAEGWAFVGCAPEEGSANDGIAQRTLPGALLGDDELTNEVCVNFCAAQGFVFAGSEYGRECWCANEVLPSRFPGTTPESLAGCNMRCAGSDAQLCGGPGWLSLYEACVEGAECVNAVFTPAEPEPEPEPEPEVPEDPEQ